uniref:Neurogenic locus notch homolog protein 1-like isoform X2 n=1 Tax=Crassostrea virginica TaxID=6565 RepID=A0A8B8C8R8_CRAVI|nr:neurogenic locus notch homolog protein 1-like isoform X2 [Crassostrea virginica]
MATYFLKGFFLLKVCVLAVAYDDLSAKKLATQSTIFADTQSYKAENAVDRDITTCMRTEAIGPNSPYKTVWWKVDLGGVYNIYSVNIVFKNYDGQELRQRGRFAGFSLYISNIGDTINLDNSNLCYKNGLELPLLNFSKTCITSGRYVIFYNERRKEVTYPAGYENSIVVTELCEVFVYGCNKTGVYGIECKTLCPPNCKYNTCHIQNGTCFECRPGWIGTHCNTKCAVGWYGTRCKQQCIGNCSESSPCSHVNGHCVRGCVHGWHGQFCNETCTGHCKDRATCNQWTGLCDEGCAAGWTGNQCDRECHNGTFGYNCVNNCSGNCLNESPCNKQTGHCDHGCSSGYTSAPCNKRCEGSYGEECRYPCSKYCVNQTCKSFDGSCVYGCEEGFTGNQCNQVNSTAETLKTPFTNKVEDTCLVGFSISLGFNALSIVIMSVLSWKIYRLTHPGDIIPCWKSSIYETSNKIIGQESTYQELNVKDSQYQNTYIT